MNFRRHNAAWRFIIMIGLGALVGTGTAADETAPNPPPAAQATVKPVAPQTRRHLQSQISYRARVKSTTAQQASAPSPAPFQDRVAPGASLPSFELQKKLPPAVRNMEEDDWLTPQSRKAVWEKEYLSSFDRNVLNAFTLPLVGIPKAVRAEQLHEADKRQRDLQWMNEEIDDARKTDPQEAKVLEKIRNDTFTRR